MNQQTPQKNESDIYWNKFFNRIERAVGWFFFVSGFLLLISYSLYQIVIVLLKNSQISLLIRLGLFFIILGAVILLFSVIRERIVLSRKDKYSEVQQ